MTTTPSSSHNIGVHRGTPWSSRVELAANEAGLDSHPGWAKWDAAAKVNLTVAARRVTLLLCYRGN